MMMRARLSSLLFAAALLVFFSGCASEPPLKAEGVDKGLTPKEASASVTPGAKVLWGGVIVASSNLKNETQIEVLGFPLDDGQEPKTNDAPLGRFVILQPGYLETADYASGRHITVVGSLTGTRQGRIGESDYTYPVVKPDRVHLWPQESETRYTEPRFHFGVGVIFH